VTTTITPAALADACESLAADCEHGEPILGRGVAFESNGAPCCAIGHACYRAGLRPDHLITSGRGAIEDALGQPVDDLDTDEVVEANDGADGFDSRRRRVVQPLRNLARALRAMEIA
jgi:hypothetical protein